MHTIRTYRAGAAARGAFLAMFLGALAAARAQQEAAPAPAPAADEPAIAGFRCVPNSVQWNASIHFDQNGVKQGEHKSLSVAVQVICPRGPMPTVCRNLVIDEVITDTGEKLRSQNNMGADWAMWLQQQMQAEPRFHLHLQLTEPQRPCSRIALIKGRMDVSFAGGAIREATLAPIGKVLGKRVRVVNVPNGELVLRSNNNGLRLEIHRDANALLERMRLVDAQDRELPVESWGSGQQGNMMFRDMRVQAPDDGRLVLRFYSELKTATVPLEVKDLPLPNVLGGGGFDLAIEAVEPGAAAEARIPGDVPGGVPGGVPAGEAGPGAAAASGGRGVPGAVTTRPADPQARLEVQVLD